ncbi:hypothetical protein EMIHUDRAFT_113561 [Emiliania huxleyi CCMP1516]|uniref:Prolyl 4-hydroxylase alpha subunit Fe(2+) 2OG dioxygenase domain-containing protein n=2 Tax=Emiliania huxleyi TaxID=2903 RepID=A0A0D3K1Y7_EMIH1|nr:hypothetical protein EMIHUDRAFT_113561 [Emiliania huxleyi CCMP1516]EOD29772.1 hypothetical protein EMIHUDRAFT_113561 [Emiliania huxleyi CCMP1516]|eukprot:XP_005782201.1 hypothetical protein EMIHUDRAFT_113561 [Emiliania huxleyi CCMP1516]
MRPTAGMAGRHPARHGGGKLRLKAEQVRDPVAGKGWERGGKRRAGERPFERVVVYLNQDFAGGQTGFWTSHDAPGKKEHCRFLRDCEAKPHDLVVTPATGMACCMDQNLLHEGLPVTAGVKYVLRTDFVHERALPAPHPKLAGRGGGGGNASPPPDGASEWERLFETSCKNYAD